MRGWFESTFGAGALSAQFVVALIVAIVLFAIIAAIARRRKTKSGLAQAPGRQPRLAVMDMADIDDRRKLVLIRRDNVEHLVMIGGPSDLVVESAIMRNRPMPQATAPQVAERSPDRVPDRVPDRAPGRAPDRAPDRSVTGPAMQAQPRAPTRAPSAPAAGSEAASGERSGKAPGNGSAEARTASPVHFSRFVNPYKPPELTPDEEMTPGSAATAGQESPAAAPAKPAQTVAPASGAAAVAGLTAGAAALTAAAASVKRRETSPEPQTPPEKPARATPVSPAGLNGGDGTAAPAPDAATPEPTAPEPATGEKTAKSSKEPDTETIVESAAEPVAAADVTNGATAPADAEAGADKVADADSEEKVAEEMPVAEPVEADKPAETESADKTGETSADESPGEIQSDDTMLAEAADETGAGDHVVEDKLEDNIEAALAETLAPAQDPPADLAGASAEIAASAPAEAVEAEADLTAATSDTATESATQTTIVAAAATGQAPTRSLEEIMAEDAPGNDTGVATPPQTDTPAAPEPVTAAAPGDTDAKTAGKTVEPEAGPPDAVSPFPTIPEEVRRSVIEAARRAESSLDAVQGMTDGGTKITLGDLAERLEQALAEQASNLSGQLQPAGEAKPAPSPTPLDQGPVASIEAWESGELTSSGAQTPDSPRQAATPADSDPDSAPETEPRQSQAMLEDETDSGVIDFNDRKKASPENKPPDSLEDEMARLLGELTGETSGR